MESITDRVSPRLFHHARDISVHHRTSPEMECTAEIRGLLTKKNSLGNLIFLHVIDATGTIQVVCEKSTLDEASWNSVQRGLLKDRVLVRGKVGLTRTEQLSIFASNVSLVLPQIMAKVESIDYLLKSSLSTRFFLARLRRRCTEFFSERGFDEYEPHLLTTIPDSSQIRPLSVVFQGWGNPAFLNTAPSSQLLEAVLATGSPKVFSVGRCFSDAVRDGYTSAESMVVCILELDITLEHLLQLSISAVKHVFDDITTSPEVQVDLSTWEREQVDLHQIERVVMKPLIQIIDVSEIGAVIPPVEKTTAFRLVVPPNVAVVEGHCKVLEGGISIGGSNLHLERMLRLIKEIALSRIRHPGIELTPTSQPRNSIEK